MCACVRRRGSFFSGAHVRTCSEREKNARVKETFGSAEGFTDERKSHVCMYVETRKREWVDVL